jgi:hypothetical protein
MPVPPPSPSSQEQGPNLLAVAVLSNSRGCLESLLGMGVDAARARDELMDLFKWDAVRFLTQLGTVRLGRGCDSTAPQLCTESSRKPATHVVPPGGASRPPPFFSTFPWARYSWTWPPGTAAVVICRQSASPTTPARPCVSPRFPAPALIPICCLPRPCFFLQLPPLLCGGHSHAC